jgi:hypothetical protein
MIITTVAERLVERGVKLFHPSHNIPGDTTARDWLVAALREYQRRIAGVEENRAGFYGISASCNSFHRPSV